MTWAKFATIKLGIPWAITPVTKGLHFRLKHNNVPKLPVAWIAQAETLPNSIQVYDFQKLNCLVPYEIITLVPPPFFIKRQLVLRQESKTANNWTIEIEVSDIMISGGFPSQPQSSSATNAVQIPVSTTAVKFLDPNPSRLNYSVVNPSKTATLYIGEGMTPTLAAWTHMLSPGQSFVSPVDFDGIVNGIWDKADTTVKAQIVEYLP